MATKAELEAELARMRRELADLRKVAQPSGSSDAGAGSSSADASHRSASHPDLADALAALGNGDIDAEALLTQAEELLTKKPVLTALAVFAVGYLIGRSR
jgi:hypothetical protein